ncbi:MAG: hypothetical protein KF916_01145 [Microbacteriaceae bacterium]|nr:hypothetical protein [Microbacteriaceae bacterium]
MCFENNRAKKNWSNLVATQKSSLVDAWDKLTKSPKQPSPKNATLRAHLAKINREDQTYDRWQYELNNGARIWYYVIEEEKTVVLEQVHTRHPNETK